MSDPNPKLKPPLSSFFKPPGKRKGRARIVLARATDPREGYTPITRETIARLGMFKSPPPPEEANAFADAVTSRIREIEEHFIRIGVAVGVPMTDWNLTPPEPPASNSEFAMKLREMFPADQFERVTLERRDGRWGLFYICHVAFTEPRRLVSSVPLRDASLHVRERFLRRCLDFAAAYVDLTKDRAAEMQTALSKGDQLLEILRA